MQAVPFTREDFQKLPEDLRVELIEGELVKMIVPSMRHQVLARRMFKALVEAVGWERVFFTGTGAFIDNYSVLVPDVLVLPEGGGADDEGATKAQLIVEILSPTTRHIDRGRKLKLYLRWGVEEVWLVDPKNERVEVHNALGSNVFEGTTIANSASIPSFRVEPAALFAV